MRTSRFPVGGLVVSLVYAAWAAAQGISTQAQMHARVMALYSFAPHTLSDDGRKAKSDAMDKFWDEVKADQGHALPLLRVELADKSTPPFFGVDGSGLLLSLSHAKPDEEIAAAAMARCDLADVSPSSYFYTVHAMSMDGVDTTVAALHVLDDPKFAVPVPQHAMTLDQQSVLMYLLLPVAQAHWMDAAKARFAIEKDENAQRSLLGLFFYTQTQEGDAALAAAADDPGKSEAVRKDAQTYLQDAKDALHRKVDVKGTEAEIRAARRTRMGAVSDEAIDDMQEITVRLVQLRAGQK